jgi:hypothetical protein
MLVAHGDWMPLGGADEQKPAADGTVEAWARSADTPGGGWYGLRKGYRGRFGHYLPPLLRNSVWPSSPAAPATTGCALPGRHPADDVEYRRMYGVDQVVARNGHRLGAGRAR